MSSWEQTKKRSKYHFDNKKYDSKFDTIIRLGHIRPNWLHQIDEIVANSKAVTWRTRSDPSKPIRTEDELISEEYDLVNTGYGKDYKITNLNWDIPDNLKEIANRFALDNSMIRIHVQHPGQVWNLHLDKLEKFCPKNPNKVIRIMIHLTDWEQGHFFSYGNYTFSGWKAGDVVTFDWQNVPHSTANAGHKPRITLQLTGIITEKTRLYIENLN